MFLPSTEVKFDKRLLRIRPGHISCCWFWDGRQLANHASPHGSVLIPSKNEVWAPSLDCLAIQHCSHSWRIQYPQALVFLAFDPGPYPEVSPLIAGGLYLSNPVAEDFHLSDPSAIVFNADLSCFSILSCSLCEPRGESVTRHWCYKVWKGQQ